MPEFALIALLVFPSLVAAKNPQDVVEHLQDVSVTIRSAGGEGSGVVVTRTRGDETHNFIWTAAHVVEGLRSTRKVIDPRSGTERTRVEFKDAVIVKEMTSEGRTVGRLELYASVMRYSADEDLALLRVRKKNFLVDGAAFALDLDPAGRPAVPPLNTDLIHVGSLLGQVGSNSLTRGVLSHVGRLIDDRVFDQTSVVAFPGSSGGGVFYEDGRLIGLLVRGSGVGFNLIVPVRRIRGWAQDAGVEWAVDPAVPMPDEGELKKLPVEDVGAAFGSAKAASKEGDGAAKASTEAEFPTMFKR